MRGLSAESRAVVRVAGAVSMLGGHGVEFRVLGPLQATRDGGVLPIGSAYKPRLVLAGLLSRADQTVSLDWLVGLLWDGHPPASARRNVQLYIHRLRAVVGSDRIPARPGGYLIRAGDALDAAQFRRLATQGSGALRGGDVAVADDKLRAALDLWRGPAYAEFADCPAIAEEAARLDELRLTVYEQWTEAELALGRHDRPVHVLSELVRAHPYRESLRGLLMRALYGAGRQADALRLYRDTRTLLAEQLGIEPGPQLQRLHEQMLHGEAQLAPASVDAVAAITGGVGVPRELPADVAGFAGRADALKALDEMLPGDANETVGPVVISAVSGTAGVGKTALAVHWAHRVHDRFPHGQLYVNLRGFDPTGAAMAPAEAIRRFLDALAVAPQRIPTDPDAQVNLYRTLLAGRRMLVVLDNARDPDQVAPLLPGAPGCLVLVTSRSRLTGLIASTGARPLPLDLLTVDEARDLLVRRLGPDRVAAEPDATDELITRCARLPLALAIVAANAATHPDLPLAALADQLRHSRARLDALSTSDTPTTDVRAVFSWSYRALSEDAARLFRLLGLHPGPDISVAATASLAALPVAGTRALLAELGRAGLLAENTPGRHAFHDLLRTYAADLAHTTDRDEQRHAAIHRMFDHYLHTAHAAARLLDPARDKLTLVPPRAGTAPEELSDHEQALAWFTAEHAVLLAVVDHAAAVSDTHTWQLAWAFDAFLDRRGHWHDLVTVLHVAVGAAGRLADPRAQARAHRHLAHAHSRLGRLDEAHTHLRHALDLTAQAGDQAEQAHIHLTLASVLMERTSHREAVDHSRQALDLYRAAGHRRGQANALNAIGWLCVLLGDHQQALTSCQQALALQQELGDRVGQAATRDSLGYAHHHLGQHTEAITCYQHAIDLHRALGDRYFEADSLTHLGDTHHAIGNPAAARTAWQRAQDILTEIDHPDADQIRAKLAGLEGQTAPPTLAESTGSG
jgi:DNA-binding SARP family transcriptional activator/predicted negative regulator of RcsB-dependent stress response